jgi:RND family efflux transporter MFP subunit
MPSGELERLRALQRLHRTFAASLELADLLPRVLVDTVEALEAEAGSLWLIDDSGGQLVCHTATGPAADRVEGVELPLGAGIVGAVAATSRPEIVTDTATDRRFLFQVDQQTGFTTRSMVCAPLRVEGRCLGALQILNCRTPATFFQRDDLEFLESIAADAAQALENARLYAVAQRAQDLATLLQVARELTATLNIEELLGQLVSAAAALTGCDRAAVALAASPGAPLRLSATNGAPDADLTTRVQAVAHTTDDRYVPDLEQMDAPGMLPGFPLPHSPGDCRSLLILPLRDADGEVGLLYLECSRTDAFSPTQRECASILAQQATIAIRNSLLYQQVPLLNLGGRWRMAWRSRFGLRTKGSRRRRLAAIVLVVASVLIPWDYRVVGRFQLRPAARVEVAAQTGGAIRQVPVREGQAVRQGDLLAVLDDRDVEREWTEVSARRDLAQQALQVAQAAGDASGYRQHLTVVQQEEATLALLAQRRSDSRIRSPLAGIVLTPRLEERLGEVLSRGSPFCTIGALDPLEAEVQVAEERVPAIKAGQTVFLKLTAFPGRRFRTHVTRIAATAQSGPAGTYFPAICAIANPGGRFRPGQEGWAKISLGKRPLAYVLLIRAWDTLRLWWWRQW